MDKKTKSLEHSQYFFILMMITILTIMLAIVSIIYNNSVRSSPIFLFLLTLGIGISFWVGLKRGGLLGLLLMAIWITTKQAIGVWSDHKVYFNLLELILAGTAFVAGGVYHEKLRAYFQEYLGIQQKMKMLDLEDTAIGLIKPGIGMLRLKEETDRALRYRRPLSLVLIIVHPKPETNWDTRKSLAAMRAVATTVKDATRVMDIPFVLNPEKIALLLPDTEINGVNKVLNNVMRKLTLTRLINFEGSSESLQNHAQLRFGVGVFLGYSNKPIDLTEMAEKSLQKNIELNIGNIFQNLFIDWEIIGEPVISNTVISQNTKGVFEQLDSNIEVEILPKFENHRQNN